MDEQMIHKLRNRGYEVVDSERLAKLEVLHTVVRSWFESKESDPSSYFTGLADIETALAGMKHMSGDH